MESSEATRIAVWAAEELRCELRNLQLEDALQLVHLYFEWGSPKYERAALAGAGILLVRQP